MRCIKILASVFLAIPIFTTAQSKTAIEQYHVVGNNRTYTPIAIAHYQNNKKWYAEGRYNYEEQNTFSLYIGKTFSKKKKLSYGVTPLIGGAIGNFNGISTGMNMDLDYRNFFFSSQSQYSFSTEQTLDNFFYNWSELAYQPLGWIYGGVSIQHTRLNKSQNSFEKGILVGFSFGNFTLPVYIFDPLNKTRYFIVGLSLEWERQGKKISAKNNPVNLSATY